MSRYSLDVHIEKLISSLQISIKLYLNIERLLKSNKTVQLNNFNP